MEKLGVQGQLKGRRITGSILPSVTHCWAPVTREEQADSECIQRKGIWHARRTKRVRDQERVTRGDVLERYPSWQDRWKKETQGLILFKTSWQQLLIYNVRVKSKMTGAPDNDRKKLFYRVLLSLGFRTVERIQACIWNQSCMWHSTMYFR